MHAYRFVGKICFTMGEEHQRAHQQPHADTQTGVGLKADDMHLDSGALAKHGGALRTHLTPARPQHVHASGVLTCTPHACRGDRGRGQACGRQAAAGWQKVRDNFYVSVTN